MNALPASMSLGVLALHAPDGLFSLRVNLLFAALVLPALIGAARALARRGEHRLPPVMGIMAAFIFAAQMANFPIAAGVSGHLLGGTLAAILLGPWAATLIMAAVIFFQALLGDGGITALGPNIFNMGLLGTFGGYVIFLAARGGSQRPARIVSAAAFAAWCAVTLASVAVSVQLAVSGAASLQRVLPAMMGVHMLIGVGEALITAAAVAFVLKTRPDLVYGISASRASMGGPITRFGLAACLLVCLTIGLSAAPVPAFWSAPDGLEYVGQQQGFLPSESEPRKSEPRKSEPRKSEPEAPARASIEEQGNEARREQGNGATVQQSHSAVGEREGSPAWLTLAGTSLAGGLGTLAMFAGSMLVGHALTRRSRLDRALGEPVSRRPAQTP
jgi:cobalt/nickel transport system permease protein